MHRGPLSTGQSNLEVQCLAYVWLVAATLETNVRTVGGPRGCAGQPCRNVSHSPADEVPGPERKDGTPRQLLALESEVTREHHSSYGPGSIPGHAWHMDTPSHHPAKLPSQPGGLREAATLKVAKWRSGEIEEEGEEEKMCLPELAWPEHPSVSSAETWKEFLCSSALFSSPSQAPCPQDMTS